MAAKKSARARAVHPVPKTTPANGRSGRSRAVVPGPQTIGGYLIERLYDLGIRHVFGIPGDYVLGFYKMLEDSRICLVGTTREDSAGFAADAYARVNGLGAVCVTYCVGGLSLCNPIAGAYAEKSPVIVISGAPGMLERARNPLLHHRVRDFSTQREVMAQITGATAVLDDPLTAFREIDRVLEIAVRYKRPVYIELPRDRVQAQPLVQHAPTPPRLKSDKETLHEALAEATALIQGAERPMILAGVEIHRFGLQDDLLKLVERTGMPVAATLLGKSVIAESHPQYLGVYEGAMGREPVRHVVEHSDCLIMLGCFMTDINLGIYTAQLDPARCIDATSEQLQIRRHHYLDVQFADFVKGLNRLDLKPKKFPYVKPAPIDVGPPGIQPEAPVTIARLFHRINQVIDENHVVIADIGDSLFGAVDLTIHRRTEFISPAYYTSMGFAVPAAVGAQFARPDLRPLVLVGDGAFQMTGMELSTVVRYRFNPIVIVLNNHGYSTERFLQEGPFNDIHEWRYESLPEVLGGGWGFAVHTEQELDSALRAALAHQESFSLLNVHLAKDDRSPALDRLARRLSKVL